MPATNRQEVSAVVIEALNHYQIIIDPAEADELPSNAQAVHDADQANPPHAGPRLDNFIKRVIAGVGYKFPLLPHNLYDGSYPTVGDLVTYVDDCR